MAHEPLESFPRVRIGEPAGCQQNGFIDGLFRGKDQRHPFLRPITLAIIRSDRQSGLLARPLRLPLALQCAFFPGIHKYLRAERFSESTNQSIILFYSPAKSMGHEADSPRSRSFGQAVE